MYVYKNTYVFNIYIHMWSYVYQTILLNKLTLWEEPRLLANASSEEATLRLRAEAMNIEDILHGKQDGYVGRRHMLRSIHETYNKMMIRTYILSYTVILHILYYMYVYTL